MIAFCFLGDSGAAGPKGDTGLKGDKGDAGEFHKEKK